jgi:hypothetical protein
MLRPLYTQEGLGTHCAEGWVGFRTSLDSKEILALTGFRSQDRPAHSQSLYRLRYPRKSLGTTSEL